MPLATYIEENLDRLVGEWSNFARSHLSSEVNVDEQKLRDGGAAVLKSIVGDMRTSQTGAHRQAKSLGERPDHAPQVTSAARDHAVERLKSGFTLDELIAEYRALRGSVFRGWTSATLGEHQAIVEELVRFDEAMDQSLSEAVTLFNERVERARDVFVGILGHDLRTPIGAARAAAEVERLSEDPEQRRWANDNLLRNLDRVSTMLDGLLDFARTRLGGRLPISAKPCDLREVCDGILDSLELSRSGCDIRREYSGDLRGSWDAERIGQLLANLTENALDYGADESAITVTARGETDDVVLSVHNHGAAIPEERLPTIFDPLVRGALEERNKSRSSDSMGLGLFIVKQIAEAHGGSAEVISEASRGTVFSVRLPRNPQN